MKPNLILDKIGFSSDFEPKFLDTGSFKECWQVSEDKVLLVYKDIWSHEELLKSYNVWKDDLPWKILEPRVFEIGSDNTTSWAIVERFRQMLHQDAIYNVVFKVDYLVEKYLEKNYMNAYEDSFLENMTKKRFKEFTAISKIIYEEYLNNLDDECNEDASLVKSILDLNDDWILELIQSYVFKIKTNRDGDLFVKNLGFRLKTGRPVFFDC